MPSNKIDYRKIFLNAFLSALVTFVVGAIISFFIIQSADISVSNSVQLDGQYFTTISIKNFEPHSIEDIDICIAREAPIINVFSKENHTVDVNNNIIKFTYIQPKENFSFIIVTEKELDAEEITVNSNSKIQSTYLKNVKPITETLLITIGIYLFMFFLNTVFTLYLDQKKRIELAADLMGKISTQETDINKLTADTEKTEGELNKTKEELHEVIETQHKLRIYYLIRIRDLNKELEFWRNTIRKLLYTAQENKITVEQIINQVTDSLKTYSTREKHNDSIDETLYLAKLFNEKGGQ